MLIGVTFYQRQRDKLNYSVRQDGSFETAEKRAIPERVVPIVPAPEKFRGGIGDRTPNRTQTKLSPKQKTALPQLNSQNPNQTKTSITRKTQPSAAPSQSQAYERSPIEPPIQPKDQPTESTQRQPTQSIFSRITLSKQLFERLSVSQQERRDPYDIIAKAKRKHSPLQNTTFSAVEKLKENSHKITPSHLRRELQHSTETLQKTAQGKIDESFESLKSQLEKRFLIDGLSLSDLPISVASRVKSHADKARLTLKERTVFVLKQIENKASEAVTALQRKG